jgi:hypothetical protein
VNSSHIQCIQKALQWACAAIRNGEKNEKKKKDTKKECESLGEFSRNLILQTHPIKSQVMCCCETDAQRESCTMTEWWLMNQSIAEVKLYVYLGIVLTHDLDFKKHIDVALQSAHKQGRAALLLGVRRGELHPRRARLLDTTPAAPAVFAELRLSTQEVSVITRMRCHMLSCIRTHCGHAAHSLHGRRHAPVPHWHHRICTFCLLAHVDDNAHFLLHCPYHVTERVALIHHINQILHQAGSLLTWSYYNGRHNSCNYYLACQRAEYSTPTSHSARSSYAQL